MACWWVSIQTAEDSQKGQESRDIHVHGKVTYTAKGARGQLVKFDKFVVKITEINQQCCTFYMQLLPIR